MQKNIIHVLELVWLSLAVLSLLAGIYNWMQAGISESIMFFVIALMSVLMYLYRRNLRKSRKD